jgi:hypothetical protein
MHARATRRTALLLIGSLFAGAPPCPAASAPRAPILVADSSDGWGVGRVLSRFRTRTGAIQLSVGFMALGLFILMRKFADPPAGLPRIPRRPHPGADRTPSMED